MSYDYRAEMANDIRQFISDELDNRYTNHEELEEFLNDRLFVEDAVTGNASGSYTFNAYEAEENLKGNFDLLVEAFREFGCEVGDLENGPEYCDVTIRCYLLSEVISSVLDDMESEGAIVYDDDEEDEEGEGEDE